MAQNVLVDLDLNANLIHNLADAVDPLDAVNKQQLDAGVGSAHVAAVGVDAIAVDGPTQAVSLLLDPASGELTQGPTGLAIDLSGYALTTDNDLKADKTVTVTAGDGLTGGGTLDGPDVPLAVLADPAADNALVVGPTGLFVPTPAAATVLSVTGTAPVVVTDVAGDITVAIDPAAIGASKDYVDAADALKADKVVTVTAGNGLTGGGTLAGPDVPLAVLADPAADNALIVGPTGLYVQTPDAATVLSVTGNAPVVVTDAAGDITVTIDAAAITAARNYVDAADDVLQAAIDAEVTARTDADLLKADKVVTVTPGLGLQGGGTLAGPDVAISVLVDPTAGNQLTVGPTGLLVAPAAAVAVTDVVGVAGETIVTDTAGSHAVGIDPLYTTARSDYTDAAELAVNTRIDGLTITGTGAVTVDSTVVDTWVVHVDTLQLANTYVGPGTDSTSIGADIVTQGGTAETGDLYINSTTGQAFVNTGQPAPDDWVELAQAPAGIVSITSPDASINVVVDGPPTASIQLSDALHTEITDATADNVAQDARLDALETTDHVPAASGNGTSVDATSQVVTVVADPASPEVTVSAAGVKVDLTAYAKAADANTELALKADKGTVVNAGIGLQGGGNLGADVTIDVGVAVAGGLQADASGLWIDTGKALGVDADGLSVKVGTGLTYNATTDAIDVAAVAANVVAGDVTTVGGTGTFAHNLGTTDVTVSVKLGGCHVTAAVCDVDANSISIEAADNTYRVVVAGVVI